MIKYGRRYAEYKIAGSTEINAIYAADTTSAYMQLVERGYRNFNIIGMRREVEVLPDEPEA